eukprot:CAMPEP_0198276388 /NCGR_PEP_ID=MMETSP1447-20131203/65288_1 /TAXON_ID=420782 /ORGANISM="Chaetoceros dichaeta, Strain CCMP1751" /LENGTH=58 /DNA_ID=CAMNT_0043971333 /DNA_START=1742 /DNA_END=1914 /DNA_ORIENTATION=+
MSNCEASGPLSGQQFALSSRDVISNGIQIYVEEMDKLGPLFRAPADTYHKLSKQPIKP